MNDKTLLVLFYLYFVIALVVQARLLHGLVTKGW